MSRKWWLLLGVGFVCFGLFFMVLFAGSAKYGARSEDSAAKPAVAAPPDRFSGMTVEEEQNQPARGPTSGSTTTAAPKAPPPVQLTAPGYAEVDQTVALEDGRHRFQLNLEKNKDGQKQDKSRRRAEKKKGEMRWETVSEEAERRDEPADADEDDGKEKDARARRGKGGEDEATAFLPRTFYFENTYLGGNAAHAERLRRLDASLGGVRPHHEARLPPQPFDAPTSDGLALSATLDHAWLEKPGRVVLQVGLQGSHRFGWRRPPLDVVLVIDEAVLSSPRDVPRAIEALRKRLGPRDRMGVVLAARTPRVVSDVRPIAEVRRVVGGVLSTLRRPAPGGSRGLAAALRGAGDMLKRAAGNQARVPGSQTVLLLARGGSAGHVAAAAKQIHELTVQGAVTSVVDLAPSGGDWWSAASAGHGNYHRATAGVEAAVDAELESLSRVIARLLRINVRLAPDVEAVRILGTRVLGAEEVRQVKAREVATDRNLSATLGVKADRGEDDDGIQTVIPYFYGGDAHVVLIELEVKKPGPVADVTLRYKDMVALENATARAGVALGARPRNRTPTQLAVVANVRGFAFAEQLATGAKGDIRGALEQASRVARGADQSVVAAYRQALARGVRMDLLRESLLLASQRRIGQSPR